MDRITDAIECLQQLVSELAGEKDTHGEHAKRFPDLKHWQRCAEKLARFEDAAADAQRHDDAIIQYSAALSLNPARPQDFFIKRSKEFVAKWSWEDALDDTNHVIILNPLSTWGYESVLTEWAKAKLTDGSWRDALRTVGGCELLETVDRVMDATECIHELANELAQEIEGKEGKWVLDFKSRCFGKLEDLGDAAMNTQQYDEAISQYSAALSLNPTTPQAQIFVKRSKARAARGLWEDASNDANEAISLDPSSPSGYERKYVASRGAGHHQDTLHAFETMLLKMTQSTDPEIRERCRQYTETRGVIRKAIQDAIRESPRVLINTTSGRLCNKSEQATAFELLPVFTELISSKTERMDYFRIEQEVAQYYRYATLSHKWEDNEPLFEKRGDLAKSIWNTRAWTFQEYHASKVVRFYTEDWTPYMNIDIPNHKESPDIISEMEVATGVSARALMALRPGLDDIREKLCLASIRKTTFVEDAAYSLLGIFSASLSVVYGEGDKSLGRLLAQLLTSSGDMNILAWTGRSGSFNSCLPGDITVFHELPTSHIPPAIKGGEMDVIIAGLRVSSLNLALAMKLYDRLDELPVPLFVGQRMKLPCMRFKLGSLSPSRSRSERVFRAQTAALGIVQIRTRVDLSRLDSLYLIHPWIDFLLDRRPVGSVADMISEDNTDDWSSLVSELASFLGPSDITLAETQEVQPIPLGLPLGERSITPTPSDAASLRPPSSILQTDKEMRALRLIARLRQPFGALLVTPTRQNVAEYRRVASESRITVQVQEGTSLDALVDSARMLDVL
ncbi:hypothetical protein J3R82DRAFT_2958 [Butyriboletus roseoflavus]|nr:hypothetical protein J3R82DRAFT_2958 [Butyriboletus roseoflavus]